MPKSIAGTTVLVYDETSTGLVLDGTITGATSTPPTTADTYAIGCVITNLGDGQVYRNIGTSAAPVWSVTQKSSNASVTATDDGTTTGAISAGTTFASITSAGATKQVALPAITTASIGQSIDLYVGANGYELITPASSNNTINTVDADGTNQLDVAANTLLRCVQVSATGWACYQVAATTITVVAPDND